MLVKEIMKRPFVIDRDITLSEAAKLMGSKNIGCLIFVSGNRIKGIITERDLLKNFSRNEKVSKVMTKGVTTIDPNEGIEDAIEKMRQKKIKRLPVVENGKLVGIVTLTDIAANYEALEGSFFFE